MARLEAGAKLGRYTILAKVATGGMAEVYLARQSGPSGFAKTLVLKVILEHLAENPRFLKMFHNEAKLAALLNHPNVVQIFDFGVEDDAHFMAMEYIDGVELRRLVDQEEEDNDQRMELNMALRVISDACGALEYAHGFTDPGGRSLEIIHRDVSLDNVLVTYAGQVKLVDFGIAKARNLDSNTQQGALRGKYQYMAPELLKGDKLDSRVDIFSMGVVLFRVLTGRMPFGGNNIAQLINSIVNKPLPSPRELNPDIPEQLERVVFKALARDRDERYQRAGELQADLESYLISTGTAVMPFHLSQYMSRVFPPGSDPRRSRYQGLSGGSSRSSVDRVSSDMGTRVERMLPLPDRDPAEMPDPSTIRTVTGPAEDLAAVAADDNARTNPFRKTVVGEQPDGADSEPTQVREMPIEPSNRRRSGAHGQLADGFGIDDKTPTDDRPLANIEDDDTPRSGTPLPEVNDDDDTPPLGTPLPEVNDDTPPSGTPLYEIEDHDTPPSGRPAATPRRGNERMATATGEIAQVSWEDPSAASVADTQRGMTMPDLGQGEGSAEMALDSVQVGAPTTPAVNYRGTQAGTEPVATDLESALQQQRARQRSQRKALMILGALVLMGAGGVITYLSTRDSDPLPTTPDAAVTARDSGAEAPSPDSIVHADAASSDQTLRADTSASPPIPDLSPPPDTKAQATESGDETEATPARGLLTVRGPTPAEVYIGRRKLGNLPLSGVKVTAGRYRVRVRSARLGYSVSRGVQIKADGHTRVTVKPQKGSIRVLVRPWAKVTLNGKSLGTTPLPPVSVYEGTHRLVLKNNEMGVVEKRRVVVKGGKETVVKVRLQKK